MNEQKNYVIKCNTGNFVITGHPATITITPAEIINAVEKSNLLSIQRTTITTIIKELIEQGVENLEEILSKVQNMLMDNPELWNSFIEIINSIPHLLEKIN